MQIERKTPEQAAAQDALPVWKSQLGNTDKLFAYTASTSRANQQHADHQRPLAGQDHRLSVLAERGSGVQASSPSGRTW